MNGRNFFLGFVVASLGLFAAGTSRADDDDDDDRDERRHRHSKKHKEKFWDGNCKIEREWKGDRYKEERECRSVRTPTAMVVYPPWIVVEQATPVYVERPAVPSTGVFRCQSRSVGQVLGAIVGGALGNQIGKGNGRTVATIGGAVAGILVGGNIGSRIDSSDQACVGEILEFAPAGHRVQWQGGAGQYAVLPGPFSGQGRGYCRPYTFEQKTALGWQRIQGNACRRTDGVWQAA